MTEPNPDELRRVYVQIAAMRKNLGQQPTQHDADRFHEQLDRLDRAGFDVAEFRLDPNRDMFNRVTSSNYVTGETRRAPTKTVRLGVLESKMDAILMYFQTAGDKEPIGFTGPRKR